MEGILFMPPSSARKQLSIIMTSKLSLALVVPVICIFAFSINGRAVRAQSSIRVVVVNGENRPVYGIALKIKGSKITSPLTDRRGRTLIKIPQKTGPGETICLTIAEAPKDTLLVSPFDGCTVVPSRNSVAPLSIVLSMRGDASFLTVELEKRKRALVDVAMRAAERAYSSGKYEDAVKSYREVLVIQPDDPEALNGLGGALTLTGNYKEAESAYIRASEIHRKKSGENADFAKTLQSLSDLYRQEGKYVEAEMFYKRALSIIEKILGPADPALATTLNGLGALYAEERRYSDATSIYERAIYVLEKAQLGDSVDMAYLVNNLANVYHDTGDLRHAEELYQRSLSIFQKTIGGKDPHIALLLDNLGALYMQVSDYSKAESFLKEALAIRETMSDDVAISYSLNNIAVLYLRQKNYEKAEPYLMRALAIRERALGSDDINNSYVLGNLGDLYSGKGDYSRAEPLYLRALDIVKRNSDSAAYTGIMKRLAKLYKNKGDYDKAESLYREILKREETLFGSNNPALASTLDDYAELLSKMNRLDEASKLTTRANLIRQADQNDLISVEISDPVRDGIAVASVMVVKGRANIPANSHLWVLAHRSDLKDVWWPQGEGKINSKTGLWEVSVTFGNATDVGREFEVSVIVVNNTDHESLLRYREEAMRSSVWNPIQSPPSLLAPQVRKVVRDK